MVSGNSIYPDRLQQLKAFDESKAGVKGIVDAGITKVPPIFVWPQKDDKIYDRPTQAHLTIPVVDLADNAGSHAEMVDGVRRAAESVGFFQVMNHGIPKRVLDEMLAAVREFHELPREVKAEYYSRDPMRKVKFFSSFNLFELANWRDSLYVDMAPEPLDPQELPMVCRDITMEYSQHVFKLSVTLFELLSEALKLKLDHLINLDCAKGHSLLSHYYPPCPEPELITMGTGKHFDAAFLTILLQDHIGGLQIQYQNKWIDVPPMPEALVVNVGDFLQLISNNKLISVNHRVLSKKEGPRISVACFFRHISLENSSRMYEPIKELISEENPLIYQKTSVKDYVSGYFKKRGYQWGFRTRVFEVVKKIYIYW